MYARIGLEFNFSSAHYLPGHEKCGVLHGHNYKVIVELGRELKPFGPDEKMGIEDSFVIDFAKIRKMINTAWVNELDHNDLNQIFVHPTAERMALDLYTFLTDDEHCLAENIAELGITVHSVTIWETDKAYAKVVASDNVKTDD